MKKILTNNIAIAVLIGSLVISISIIINSLLVYFKTNSASDPQKIYQNITYVKTTNSPYLGNPDAPVTIVEYIDFECPVCKKVYDDIYPRIKNDYILSGKVKFVFKSLPITQIHKTAFRKTEASFCAYDQAESTAFFTYHDILFDLYPMNNSINLDNNLINIAAQIKLDTGQFRSCLNTQKYKKIIEQDIVEATAIDATGTPTWLIGKTKDNGISDTVKLNGLYTYDIYRTIIDRLLTQN